MKLFFKKVSTLPLTLVGVSQREARETGALPRFSRTGAHREGGSPGAGLRASACPLRHAKGMTPPPKGEARLGSPLGGRYVPVGRCPAADRGGSRDAGTAAAVTERATRQRPAPIRVPPPSLIPKGGTRFGRGDRKARRKPPWHRRCHQETPGEGFLRKTVHRTIFLFSCAC